MALFMTDIERRSASRMIAYLKGLGSKRSSRTRTTVRTPVGMQNRARDVYDYVDDHFSTSTIRTSSREVAAAVEDRHLNPVLDKNLALINPAYVRPGGQAVLHHGVELLWSGHCTGAWAAFMTGALSHYRTGTVSGGFAYSHNAKDLVTVPACRLLQRGTDPLGQASDRAEHLSLPAP